MSAPPAIVAQNWKPVGKATIVGSADVIVVKWQLPIKACRWHRQGDKEWLGLPSKEWVDQNGKRQFADIISFTSHGTFRRFREAALAAIKAAAGEESP